ncbi:alpha-L-glutamate ligase-like protein [Coraliomargarita akajimensis]|uniref:Alpha-L-glutamate ligase-like protein n=1 Tax=Coraliomargarita akajimensis (strain DSM 45221 / IAM 15411 / JCM 23193 / KCTC 12865 / 04OKA010-24) TaxID=583355 RepID=D5EPU1_CORAD|nr:alpha-L-glutamate ligase-like protein [Coraliomargarita akajimensis]ADE55674.1 alpha-L-glutamate ligase-like protein [Coraliomargarita akajimensis DSM 45221]
MIGSLQWCRPSELRARGIVGMNQRNSAYIARYNDRKLYPRVDDKYITKELALEFGIKVPELIGLVRHQHEVKGLANLLAGQERFVIKPSMGSAGKGILVVVGREGDRFLKPSGEALSLQDIRRHVNNTLSGLYSLGGRNDKAMIEEAIEFSDVFDGFSYQGVPDIRVIVFQGYPIMAMMRLSTKSSDGKANLHQGAVGVGIDIVSGKARSAVQWGKPVLQHPDTGRKLAELKVPHWDEIVELSACCYEMTELGYLGADVVLDKHKGPQILELNARPGLAIQVANNIGLLPRLQLIENISRKDRLLRTPQERVAFSRKHFAET